VPSGRSRTQRYPRAWKRTRSPWGETATFRSIFTSKLSGCTSRVTRWVSAIWRVVRTRKGISVTSREATSMRWIPPSAQKTTLRLSGVQAMVG
jgi:type IV pilus biogenesis protein CpaD/CtpE